MNQNLTLFTAMFLFGIQSVFAEPEVERLRRLCTEQERQIRFLEEKVARLTESPPPPKIYQPLPSSIAPEGQIYVVQAGDSLDRIALKFQTNLESLAKLNGLDRDSVIQPNQSLRIPVVSTSKPLPSKPTSAPVEKGLTHKVAQGDTFYKIAKKYGVSVDKLIKQNSNINPNALRIGQSVIIQPKSAPVPETKSPENLSPTTSHSVKINGPIRIDREMTYEEFAKQHGTTTEQLDQLNAIQLQPSAIMAKGSELYVPSADVGKNRPK